MWYSEAVYVLVRLDQVTIILREVVFSPLSIIACFVLVACGALMFPEAHSRMGRAVALSVITFASWSPMVFGSLVITAFNVLLFIPQKGTPLHNYALGLLPAGSFVLSISLASVALTFIQRLESRNVGKEEDRR